MKRKNGSKRKNDQKRNIRKASADYILGLNWSGVGSCVFASPDIPTETAELAVAMCRRRFKAEEIIVLSVLDEDETGERGIAFTDKAIISWRDAEGSEIDYIPYRYVKKLDYSLENVSVLTEKQEYQLYCGWYSEKERYAMRMYNFIADIVDSVRGK